MQLPLQLPVGVGELVEAADRARAGAVDEGVGLAESLDARVYDSPARAGIGHVFGQRRGPATGRARLLRGRLQRLGPAPDEQDLRPLGAQQPRCGAADPAARARDDARTSRQSQVHSRHDVAG